MASINIRPAYARTHEGAPAAILSPIQQLRRSVMACMLWESGFYESGVSVADRIKSLVAQCDPDAVASLAVEARTKMHLRHAPLLLVRELVRHPALRKSGGIYEVWRVLVEVIQRPDDMTEFLALYWREGKQPLARQVKRGLAAAFRKFSAYQLAKYNRDGAIRLRDVLFMVHAKPRDAAQADIWRQLVDGTLPPPDTWEVALSAGADKRETWTRLLTDEKLGYLALLRNLRNMESAGVSRQLVADAIAARRGADRVLPFRYVAAARACPQFEPELDAAMQASMKTLPRLPGRTVVLVDVSVSMDAPLSAKSDLTRLDAASALAVLLSGIGDAARVFTFSDRLVEVPPRTGMALIDAIRFSQAHSGTLLGAAVRELATRADYDRLVVITDEQSSDPVGRPLGKGYMLNVGVSACGIQTGGGWERISGFSESVVSYIAALEAEEVAESEAGAGAEAEAVAGAEGAGNPQTSAFFTDIDAPLA